MVLSLGSWNPPAAPLVDDAPMESSHLPPESAYFLSVNRNKRSLTVDFKSSAGLEILHRLIKQSDIFIENFIPGKLASIGLGWDDCHKINPRLIYTSITGNDYGNPFHNKLTHFSIEGYGQTGPYRGAAGYDVIIEGEGDFRMHPCLICDHSLYPL